MTRGKNASEKGHKSVSKYPDAKDVDINNMPHYDTCLELINANASEENVETVAKRASGSAGPLGVDSVSFSHWLLPALF